MNLVYQTRWKPQICYCLYHTTFTDSECEQIRIPVENSLLPQMSFHSKTLRAVIHRSIDIVGVGINDIKVKQMVLQMQDLLQQMQSQNHLGKQYHKIAMAAYQATFGTHTSFFQIDYESSFHKPENSKFTMLWRWAQNLNFKLEGSAVWVPPMENNTDTNIMSAFITICQRQIGKIGTIAPRKLVNANACRMYLRTYNLSDHITTEDGTRHLAEWAMRGTRQVTSSLHFPYQERPAEAAWKDWQELLIGSFVCFEGTVLVASDPTDTPPPPQLYLEEFTLEQPWVAQMVGKIKHDGEGGTTIAERLKNGHVIYLIGGGSVGADKKAAHA
jgi:hypothetical protein